MVSSEEKKHVLQLPSFERYRYFIKRVAALEVLWTLVNEDGDLAISSDDDFTFVHFWSAKEYIEDAFLVMWENVEMLEININELDGLLGYIENRGYLIDVFPINGMSGFVVDVNEFARDLNAELEQYE